MCFASLISVEVVNTHYASEVVDFGVTGTPAVATVCTMQSNWIGNAAHLSGGSSKNVSQANSEHLLPAMPGAWRAYPAWRRGGFISQCVTNNSESF
jgi:hypothetical protein